MSHILVVEDNEGVADVFMMALTDAGYQVAVAGTKAAALSEALTKHPDLILLDIALGTENGVDVANALYNENITAPIIIVSSGLVPAAPSGIKFASSLQKPISPKELIAAVVEQLAKVER